jgi:predicted transcriptional regulator
VSTTISFRIEEAKRDELDEVAKFLDHDRTYVLNEAVDLYLENRRWQLDRLHFGTEAADAGRIRPHAEVKQHMADYMQRARKAKSQA